jgi:hypothetical protein
VTGPNPVRLRPNVVRKIGWRLDLAELFSRCQAFARVN